VAVGVLSAAIGSGATLLVIRAATPSPAPAARAAPPAPKSTSARVAPEDAPEPPIAPTPSPALVGEPAPVVRLEPRPRAAPLSALPAPAPTPAQPAPELGAPPSSPRPAPPLSPAAALTQELELLRGVLIATQEQRWADAQRALDEHERRFVPAALRSEARAMQVLVWCGTGRIAEARQLARELEGADPLNPAVQRLRGTCAE